MSPWSVAMLASPSCLCSPRSDPPTHNCIADAVDACRAKGCDTAPPMQASPHIALTKEDLEYLTKRTQDGGTEVVQAKAGKVCSAARCKIGH
jgi:hypothetical protein